MKKQFLIIISSLACLLSGNSHAATVAGYTFADDAFVDTLVSSTGTFYNYESATAADSLSSAQLAADLTDTPNDSPVGHATYVFSNDSNASVDLAFSSVDVVNGSGNDLAFFFVGLGSSLTLSIAETEQTFETFDTGIDITDSFGTYALTAALVDLDDFGFASNQLLGDFNVLLGNTEALSLVGAFNTGVTPVPVPAAAWLFITGLTALGMIGRRRRKQ